jgi:uncharacterized protein with FMN-binding domain
MKKIFLSTVFVVAFVGYALYATIFSQSKSVNSGTTDANTTPNNPNNTPTNNNPSATGMMGQQGNRPTGMGSGMKSYAYADGTYTGNSADAYYGNVQVKVSIQNHLISDVQFLDYPQDRGTSLRISGEAMPILKSEAIQAQSANVDIVSGATQTSQAFIESLKSALALAQQ